MTAEKILSGILIASGIGIFVYGYVKYNKRIKRYLKAGEVIKTKNDLIHKMQQNETRIQGLGIVVVSSTYCKIHGKVVTDSFPIEVKLKNKKEAIFTKSVYCQSISKKDKDCVPWKIKLEDGTEISVDIANAEMILPKAKVEETKSQKETVCMYLPIDMDVVILGEVFRNGDGSFQIGISSWSWKWYLISHLPENQLILLFFTKFKRCFYAGMALVVTGLILVK